MILFIPLREEISREFIFANFFCEDFAGIKFRQFGFTEDFAGIDFRELSLTKDFAGINFRESTLFSVVNLTFAFRNIFSTTLVYGF